MSKKQKQVPNARGIVSGKGRKKTIKFYRVPEKEVESDTFLSLTVGSLPSSESTPKVEVKLHYIGDKGIVNFIKELENEVSEEKNISPAIKTWTLQKLMFKARDTPLSVWNKAKQEKFIALEDLKKVLDDKTFEEWKAKMIIGFLDDLEKGNISITEMCNAIVTHYDLELQRRLKIE